MKILGGGYGDESQWVFMFLLKDFVSFVNALIDKVTMTTNRRI